MAKRYNNDSILVIGDTHFPAHHKNTFKFLSKLNEGHNFDRVIHTGDLLDQYVVSRFPSSPAADSVVKELRKAKKAVKRLGTIFPCMDIMSSNHDDRFYQRATVNGIPREFLLPYMELIEAPAGWKLKKDLKITINSTREHLYVAHTRTGTTLNTAKALGCNVAVGHKHHLSGIQYINQDGKTSFAADVGCLISDEDYFFDYNKLQVNRPVRSILMIIKGVPQVINMDSTIKMWRREGKW